MEDFGDILFYLIAAIIGIGGLIANKKKKKAESSIPKSGIPRQEDEIFLPGQKENTSYAEIETARARTEYEMIDMDSFKTEGVGYEHDTVKPPQEEAIKMRAELEGSYSEPLANDFASEGKSVTDITVLDSELWNEDKDQQEEKISWARNLIRDFDLPKAIVYSEILQRKDFV
ncbi:MAG TPA: hypothetical protein DEQ09_08175 [Bacteroidales bacterium]|nr:hypothetical protein [Bacteroidales bacterium]